MFYLLPYLVEVQQNVAIGLLLLIGLIAFANAKSWFDVSYLKVYGWLYLFLLSNTIFFYKHGPTAGGGVFILLVCLMHSVTNNGGTSLVLLNKVAKFFLAGLILLFVCFNFIPLISRYPFTLGSWYLVASENIPFIRTTLDGPVMIIIIVAFLYILLKAKIKSTSAKLVCFILLAFLFYTLMVFNRRTVITMFLLLIPFIYFEKIKDRKWFILLFLLTFLLPINFAIFLTYANELSSIPIIHDITLRNNDLNADDNFRLTGWIMALSAFSDLSIYDFFGFHRELVRSTEERYNNFHNGYIQLYYDQGIFGFIVTLILIIVVIKRMKYFRHINLNGFKYLFVFPVMFCIILFMCNTEAVYRKIAFTNLIFVISCFFILKTSDVIKRELSGTGIALKNANE